MKKKKIGILYGGKSVEHAVSVNSARNIYEHIDREKYEPVAIGVSKAGKWFLTSSITKDIESGNPLGLILDPAHHGFLLISNDDRFQVDALFPVLHGTYGEDGSIQGLIKAMDIPMVGTSVLGSAIAMNKIIAKKLLQEADIPVVPFLHFHFSEKEKFKYATLAKTVGTPFMLKSANLGSSVGVSKVKSKRDFDVALEEAFRYDQEVIAEQFIEGREIECAVLGNNPPIASYPGEIILNKSYEFYNFEAKYVHAEAVQIQVPADLKKPVAEKIRKISLQAYTTLQCADFARVDLFLTAKGKIYVNEINTIPGFTNSSMFPMMWKERGISFGELISTLVDLAFERHEQSRRIERDFQSALRF